MVGDGGRWWGRGGDGEGVVEMVVEGWGKGWGRGVVVEEGVGGLAGSCHAA